VVVVWVFFCGFSVFFNILYRRERIYEDLGWWLGVRVGFVVFVCLYFFVWFVGVCVLVVSVLGCLVSVLVGFAPGGFFVSGLVWRWGLLCVLLLWVFGCCE